MGLFGKGSLNTQIKISTGTQKVGNSIRKLGQTLRGK